MARELDDEREHLETTAARVGDADKALETIADLLSQASDLVDANVKGAGTGKRKSNQRQVDDLLKQVDEVAQTASKDFPELFDGKTTFTAGDGSIDVDEISRSGLGRLVLNGKVMSLADVARHGGLDSSKNHTAAAGAAKSLADATDTVAALREKLQTFSKDSVTPRVGDVANALAGLFSNASGLGSSEEAVKTARELRDITLASSSAAIAVGADGWDRERVIDLLT